MPNLILASSSPRRKELLENLQLKFRIHSSDVDESFEPGTSPKDIVMGLAERKAKAVFAEYPDAFVIGSDTIVVCDGAILGKPSGRREAIVMLKQLSGRTHQVFTGVAIASPGGITRFYEKTEVQFWELSDREIEFYADSGEPFDKAGAYGIQGLGSMLVKRIDGDYFAVMGLPVSRTVRELKHAGYPLPF
ncbi:septum formation inhibitor Maf [Neobacillus piezotolerans]|uniref:dTTP/UTP pyrophosphatase n=1 Tax=Neobacillus piezotolerans TaxID=2259171 RepID=A0A3D8GL27_9BACI|nr:Maf family protein [Neobacillus piezotolerans]RDU35051.1 septum formation inhibitor Maf [Neobacillus piezotolerans]